jgi:hypothetical protein
MLLDGEAGGAVMSSKNEFLQFCRDWQSSNDGCLLQFDTAKDGEFCCALTRRLYQFWQASRAVPIMLPNAWDMDLHPDNIKNKFELALESQGYTVAN